MLKIRGTDSLSWGMQHCHAVRYTGACGISEGPALQGTVGQHFLGILPARKSELDEVKEELHAEQLIIAALVQKVNELTPVRCSATLWLATLG